MSTLWDVRDDMTPAMPFAMGLRLDDIYRRVDAMRAIMAWTRASMDLRFEAAAELDRAYADAKRWDEDADIVQAARRMGPA